MNDRKTSLRVYSALILMTLLFGSSFVATKTALNYLHPFQIVAVRYLLAFLAMSLLFQARESFRKLSISSIRKDLFIIILTGPILYFFFETFGIKYANPSEISLLIALIPISTFLLASLLLKEKLTWLARIAAPLSFFGAFLLIIGEPGFQFQFYSLKGKLFGLGAVIVSSIYNIHVKKISRHVTAIELTYLQSFFAVLFYLPLSLMVNPSGYPLLILGEGSLAGALLFLGIGCSFVAIFLMNYGFAHLEATRVAMFGNFVPIVTVTISVFLGMGFLSPLQLAGGLVIIFSLILSNLRIRSLK